MVKVVFIGDTPDKRTISNLFAFTGVPYFKKLVKWIQFIAPDYYVCCNASHDELLEVERLQEQAGFKVVALGQAASETLFEYGITHYQLPHPTGKHAQGKGGYDVLQALETAKEYVRIEC